MSRYVTVLISDEPESIDCKGSDDCQIAAMRTEISEDGVDSFLATIKKALLDRELLPKPVIQ